MGVLLKDISLRKFIQDQSDAKITQNNVTELL